ncbi:DDE-type integrase/transposase/recombinase [Psychrobacter aquaticus]|uniref:DDE-type integrase/transposase/recombinase n=1 Tax=Psychrobacter aquaticus TaxID=248452 RepID=UPI00387308D7
MRRVKAKCCFVPTHDNPLDRNFSPSAPNLTWTGDVTYIRIKGSWYYLAVFLDLYIWPVIGLAMSDSPDTTVTAAFLYIENWTRDSLFKNFIINR